MVRSTFTTCIDVTDGIGIYDAAEPGDFADFVVQYWGVNGWMVLPDSEIADVDVNGW